MSNIRTSLFSIYVTFVLVITGFTGILILDPDTGADAATITVGKSGSPDHSTIQAAVTAAGNNDIIQVWAGTYDETVVIPAGKSLDIIGAGKTQTIIDGGDSGTVVTVNADSCKIKDMKITGSGTSAGDAGILLNSDSNTIEGCNITRNNMGICLNGSDLNTISQNEVDWNYGVDPVDEGLVGYWKMDEASWSGAANEVKDSSGNGNDGVANGGVTTTIGNYGRCGDFNGNSDYVDCGTDSSLNISGPGQDISLEAWIKRNEIGASHCIIAKNRDTTNKRGYSLTIDASDRMEFKLGWGIDSAAPVCSLNTIELSWTHVVGVLSGDEVKMFINGIQDPNTLDFSGKDIYSNSLSVMIGVEGDTSRSHYFNGLIDEARIYDRALSDDEIRAQYLNGITGGIRLWHSHNNTIAYNTIVSNSGQGIQSFSSADNDINNNTIRKNYCSGAYFDNCTRNDVRDNTVQANHGVEPVTAGLVGYWKMDEASWSGVSGEVKDSSGNGNDGTAIGDATTLSGKYGRCGDFDGSNDYIDCGSEVSFTQSDSFSICVWVNTNTVADFSYAIDRTSATPEMISLLRDGDDVQFGIRGDNGVGLCWVTAYNQLDVGYWYHIAGIRDVSSDTLKIYLNGTHVADAPDTTTGINSPIIRIGSHATVDVAWDGAIDDFSLYNRALSPDEVLKNYVSGLQSGITLRGSDTNTIANNTLDANEGHGISLNTSDDNVLSGNTITDNGGCGVYLQESDDNELTGNTIDSNDAVDPRSEVGLVGYWKMDEVQWTGANGEVKDASGKGNDGTAQGGVTTGSGRFGNGGDFDGSDDYVLFGNTPVLDNILPVTYEAWVNWRGGEGIVMAKKSLIADRRHCKIDINGAIHLWIIHSGTNLWAKSVDGVVNLNKWNHIVWMAQADSTGKLYHNGVETTYTNNVAGSGQATDDSSGKFTIGARFSSGSPLFLDAIIDNVRLYNRTLSEEEVLNNYVSGIPAGIHLRGSKSNGVQNNVIIDHPAYAIRGCEDSKINIIDHNYIIDNNPGFPQAHDDGTNNDWDDGLGGGVEGNYWSDWQTPDANTPFGIVDAPYFLEGLVGNSDNYPLCPYTTGPINTTPYEDVFYSEVLSIDRAYHPGDWTYAVKPDWLTVAPNGTISGTPTNDDVGVHWINATISDDYWSGWLNFTIEVINVNDPPSILTEDILDAYEDIEYLNDYEALDIDPTEDTLQWDVQTNATFLDMDADTGILVGTPSNDDVGGWWVNVSVSDGMGGGNYSYFILTVHNDNDRPLIIGDDITETNEDQLYVLSYDVEDIDVEDTEFNWLLMTNASWLSLDTTNNITGTPTNDDVGTYDVNVSVTDGHSLFDYREFVLTVHNVNDAPIWEDIPDSRSIIAGRTYIFDVNASDVDAGDKLTFGLSIDPLPIVTMPFDTGVIKYETDEDDVGIYEFNISVTDGDVTLYHEFTIEVLTGITNLLPTSTLVSPKDNAKLDILNPTFTWTVEDGDEEPVTSDLYLSAKKADIEDLKASKRTATGIDDTWYNPTLVLEKGETYYWTVIPQDETEAGICTSGIWTFTVKETAVANHLPEFMTNPFTEAGVDSEWSYEPIVFDEDENDSVSIDLIDGPKGMVYKNGILTWTPDDDDIGDYNVTLEATDGKASVFQEFVITVTAEGPSNVPPVVEDVEDVTVEEGQLVSVAVLATDDDGDTITFSKFMGPDGADVDNTGKVTWQTAVGDAGTHEIVIKVTDGNYERFVRIRVVVEEADVTPPVNGDGGETKDNEGLGMATIGILLVIIILVVILVLFLVLRARKKKAEEEEGEKEQALEAEKVGPLGAKKLTATPMTIDVQDKSAKTLAPIMRKPSAPIGLLPEDVEGDGGGAPKPKLLPKPKGKVEDGDGEMKEGAEKKVVVVKKQEKVEEKDDPLDDLDLELDDLFKE